MPKYFLKVEAVNIANFVYDTHDISTIRGGSYLLLEAIKSLRTAFIDRLTPIATAASQGLFSFESSKDNDEVFQRLKADILQHLHQKTGGHATFLVAIEEEIPKGFDHVLERLEAKIRRQQWRMPTVTIPEPLPAVKECYLDGWRPGVEPYRVDPDITDVWASRATALRREEGRKIKHELFSELLGEEEHAEQISTQDLSELARDPSKGSLDGKIAFIHVDGNSFGYNRQKLCEVSEDREDFDNTIQEEFRHSFLRSLLRQAKEDPDFQAQGSQEEPALRLEVLLWGGDEMTLVVPAWKGWSVIRLFYDKARKLQFRGHPLTHRGAIIFCHHNAPILLIRQLAEDLLGRTKRDIKAKLNTSPTYEELSAEDQAYVKASLSDHDLGDALHYLTLESFDLLQGELDQFLEKYYKGVEYSDLLIYANELDTLLKSIDVIQTRVAYGKALKIIESLQDPISEEVEGIIKKIYELLPDGDRELVREAVGDLTQMSPDRWYLATDLWDYVPEGVIS